MFSGGVASWAAAKRVKVKEGDELVLLFADTMMEDEDLYRFLEEAAEDVGGTLVKIADGRTPWEVFKDRRYLGNSRVDPCSRILKRDLIRSWLEENCDPAHTYIYLGIAWDEKHRFDRAKKYWGKWKIKAPLLVQPLLGKWGMLEQLEKTGIAPPRLYAMGFPHNNCGGFCIKAGMAQFNLLREKFPERYQEHEDKELELQRYLGKEVTILRDRTGGIATPLSLRDLRLRAEGGDQGDPYDWGGCGCFTPMEEELEDDS
jgi:hypothetical protein